MNSESTRRGRGGLPNRPQRLTDLANSQSLIGPSIPVLAYHQIDTVFELGVNSISPQTFERQIRFLIEHGYTTITSAFLSNWATTENRPHTKRPILITFDDGYESFYTNAYPILRKYGLTATVFILTGYIGKLNTWDVKRHLKRPRHLSRDQIQIISRDGIEIGSHGMYHRFLTHCNQIQLKEELQGSKAILEDLLEQPIQSYAYPYGSANLAVEEIVKSAGYRVAFGLDPMPTATAHSIYRFPRIAIYRCDTYRSFQAKLGLRGKYRFSVECAKNRLINRFAYLNLLRSKVGNGLSRER